MDKLNRIRLLLGDEAIEKLKKSTVMIVGCGAVGSFAIEALARSGIGNLLLIDFDNIEETNINRQLFALESTIGQPKVNVAKQRIQDISKDIKVDIKNIFFDENTNLNIKPDFVIDAIDTVKSKIAIYKWCQKNNIPFISSMKKAKSSNPLFLLDEIDKVGSDWKGDPASALLEVLDPEQNSNFNDHYLEVDYDLSDVMFITTANSYKMPTPLLDRLEIIKLSGYTEMEKMEIAKRYLQPKQMVENGLKPLELTISDSAIMTLIRDYTREAGVRNLEREIAKICRKVVKELTENEEIRSINITPENLEKYVGFEKFKRQDIEDKNLVGVVTGLAWTEVGGELLSIEAVSVPGKGKITLTGKLGDVMQESIQAAISYVRSRASVFGIDSKVFETNDIHVHVPEGATPKDGPSAGVAMVTSVVSCLTSIPVKHEVAMTGEITLRGRVLPIGGLKEKLLAAHRGGIKIVIIPKANESDLQDIPQCVLDELKIIKAETADDVLSIALERPIDFR